jgi:hypothetical protein
VKEVEEETRIKVKDLVQSYQAIDAKVSQQLQSPRGAEARHPLRAASQDSSPRAAVAEQPAQAPVA